MIKDFNYYRYLRTACYFSYNEDNNSETISKELNIPLKEVQYYVNLFLSLKRNYMGVKVKPPLSAISYKNIDENRTTKKTIKKASGYELLIYDGEDLIGKFDTLQLGCDFLGIRPEYISFKLYNNKGNTTIYNRKLKKRLTYVKKFL